MISIGTFLLLAAFICFVIAFLNVPTRVNLVAGGLALWVLAVLLGFSPVLLTR